MLQRLAVTNPKNDKMDPRGVNPTFSFLIKEGELQDDLKGARWGRPSEE